MSFMNKDLTYKTKKFMSAIFIASLDVRYFLTIMRFFRKSKSQFNQDLYFLSLTLRRGIDFKNVYFVEFGAADGILHSNTFLPEQLGANGILAEPCKSFHNSLALNRKSIIDKRVVHSISGYKIEFEEMTNGQLSKMAEVEKSTIKSHSQVVADRYKIDTVSLNDLLKQHFAPPLIHYLSVDTEGSELSILESFDFSKFSFNFISVEHNYRPDRRKIHNLLSSQGYKRVHRVISRCEYWYVR